MKRIIYSCIAILSLAGFIIYGFISAPKTIHVNRQIEVTAYKEKDSSFAKKVVISLSGVFDEKSESYLGKVTVNGKEYMNCSLDTKFAMVQCSEVGNDKPPRDLLGRVFANKDFNEWSLTVGSSYTSGKNENNLYTVLNQGSTNTDDIILSTPATNRDSSLKVYNELMQRWGDEIERRSK